MNHQADHGAYCPTAEEIAAATAEIQRGWSIAVERQRRFGFSHAHRELEVPVVLASNARIVHTNTSAPTA